jgi:hypothetical protein
MSQPRTLGAAFAAGRQLELDPEWACGGSDVLFTCPQCRQDGLQALASARMTFGLLTVTCGGCHDEDTPGIIAILGGARPDTGPLATWWEPPRTAGGDVDWPQTARFFMALFAGVRGALADTATLAAEFEDGVVMGIEQRARWDAIVNQMRFLERRVLHLDDALLTAAAVDQARQGVAS